MKILIAYATKNGTTRECAELLAKQLKNHEIELLRVGKDGEAVPEIDGYDVVIFGSNVRMAKIDRELSEYLKKNEDKITGVRHAFFLCCGFIDCFEDYLYKNISETLIESAETVACFGGSLDKHKARGFDRFVISVVRSNILGGGDNGQAREDISLPTIMESNIVQFANVILGK